MRPAVSLRLVLLGAPVLLGRCAAQIPPTPAEDATLPDGSAPHTADARADAMSGPDAPGAADRRPADRKDPPDVSFAPVACADGLAFCEDFEPAALDPKKWLVGGWTELEHANQVAVELDATRVANGRRSLRFRQLVKMDPVGREAFIKPRKAFPLRGNRLFVRYLTFIDPSTPDRWFPTLLAWDPVNLARPKYERGHPAFMLGVVPTGPTTMRASYLVTWGGTLTTEGPVTAVSELVPFGRWSCWEFELRGDTRQVLLSIDDQPVKGFDLTADAVPDTIELWFGFAEGHPDIVTHPDDGFFDIWLDDVAVANHRIGCSP